MNAWACEHSDRPHIAKGLCSPCYEKTRPKRIKTKKAWNCEHTDRWFMARGLCAVCARKARKERAWACEHTDRVHAAKGLCQSCYNMTLRHKEAPTCGHPHRPALHRGVCFECYDKIRDPSGEKRREYQRRSKAKINYGLMPDDRDALIELQRNRCAICGDPPPKEGRFKVLHIDHDEDAPDKYVRGLLCNNCNNGIGRFKHDPAKLREAAHYLESPVTKREPWLSYLRRKKQHKPGQDLKSRTRERTNEPHPGTNQEHSG